MNINDSLTELWTVVRYLSLSTVLNSGWGLFYRMECFLNQLAAWLAAIIAEIAFYQWNLQEME